MIVNNSLVVVIPLDPQELADLLEEMPADWPITLDFVAYMAKRAGIVFNKKEVSDILVQNMYLEHV